MRYPVIQKNSLRIVGRFANRQFYWPNPTADQSGPRTKQNKEKPFEKEHFWNRQLALHQNSRSNFRIRFANLIVGGSALDDFAELSAAYLCAEAGIAPPVIENEAAYIQGWFSKLKNEKRLIVVAAAQAQRAADYILGRSSTA